MEIVEKKTFVGNWNITLAPLTASNPIVQLRSSAREFFLDSVTWNYRIFDNTNLYRVNIHLNQILHAYFCIGPVVGAVATPIGVDFLPNTAPNPSVADRRIYVTEPGQLFFDDVSIRENVFLWFTITNNDPANTYIFDQCVIIQIREKYFEK